MVALSPVFGVVVGFALGLTGGGGSIFAVPMLVYGLAEAPREAIGISLAAVGATALVGALQRLQAGEVDLGTGVFFAVAGMVGAPLGSWVNRYLPEPMLLVLFAGLMAFVAIRMWRTASRAVLPLQPGSSSESVDAAIRDALERGVFYRAGVLGVRQTRMERATGNPPGTCKRCASTYPYTTTACGSHRTERERTWPKHNGFSKVNCGLHTKTSNPAGVFERVSPLQSILITFH